MGRSRTHYCFRMKIWTHGLKFNFSEMHANLRTIAKCEIYNYRPWSCHSSVLFQLWYDVHVIKTSGMEVRFSSTFIDLLGCWRRRDAVSKLYKTNFSKLHHKVHHYFSTNIDCLAQLEVISSPQFAITTVSVLIQFAYDFAFIISPSLTCTWCYVLW